MNTKGLTIIESMIAMVILGIITVSISQFYQYTIYKNEHVEQQSVAHAMAHDYLELLKMKTLSPAKELSLPSLRIVNGDTLYYVFKKDLIALDQPEQGVVCIVCKSDTLIKFKSLLLPEGSYEP